MPHRQKIPREKKIWKKKRLKNSKNPLNCLFLPNKARTIKMKFDKIKIPWNMGNGKTSTNEKDFRLFHWFSSAILLFICYFSHWNRGFAFRITSLLMRTSLLIFPFHRLHRFIGFLVILNFMFLLCPGLFLASRFLKRGKSISQLIRRIKIPFRVLYKQEFYMFSLHSFSYVFISLSLSLFGFLSLMVGSI